MVAGDGQISGFDQDTEQRDILKLSHGTAIVLLSSEFLLLLKRLPLEWTVDKVTISSLLRLSLFPALFPQEFVQ